MATGSELAEQVLDIVQDPSFDEDMVLVQFNKAAAQISAQVLLPFLEATAIVIADPAKTAVSLPSNFQRNLFKCDDDTGYNAIKVLNSKAQMMSELGRRFFIQETLVKTVAVVQPDLLFAPTPVTLTNLHLSYHRKPDTITADDQVLFLPDGYEEMLVNFACWKLYSKIEQGLEGAKIDTNYHQGLYAERLEALRITYKQGVSMPDPPVSKGERW